MFDYFIVDIKSMDQNIYREYTGGELSIAINNLLILVDRVGPDKITVRVPEIPGFADVDMQSESMLKLKDLGIEDIETFRYSVRNGD